jgi:hypothetical protein
VDFSGGKYYRQGSSIELTSQYKSEEPSMKDCGEVKETVFTPASIKFVMWHS